MRTLAAILILCLPSCAQVFGQTNAVPPPSMPPLPPSIPIIPQSEIDALNVYPMTDSATWFAQETATDIAVPPDLGEAYSD